MRVTLMFNIVILFLVTTLFVVITEAAEKNGDFLNAHVSERVSLMQFLKDKGVENSLIAHYIINSKRSGIKTSDLNERLKGVSGYSFTNTQIEGWMKNVGDYDTLKAKEK
jgi:hypothetical protein